MSEQEADRIISTHSMSPPLRTDPNFEPMDSLIGEPQAMWNPSVAADLLPEELMTTEEFEKPIHNINADGTAVIDEKEHGSPELNLDTAATLIGSDAGSLWNTPDERQRLRDFTTRYPTEPDLMGPDLIPAMDYDMPQLQSTKPFLRFKGQSQHPFFQGTTESERLSILLEIVATHFRLDNNGLQEVTGLYLNSYEYQAQRLSVRPELIQRRADIRKVIIDRLRLRVADTEIEYYESTPEREIIE